MSQGKKVSVLLTPRSRTNLETQLLVMTEYLGVLGTEVPWRVVEGKGHLRASVQGPTRLVSAGQEGLARPPCSFSLGWL